VIIERLIWWQTEALRREPGKLEQVYSALEKNELENAAEIAGTSKDSVLRVLWFGLSQQHRSSLQGAFQVAAGIELERAGRFVVVLDTIVTLAPLLGLLGTVTGLMKAFFKLGTAELSEQAIGGGIAEALIATACGLSIAVVCLVFLNYYAAKVSRLQFELQTACGKAEVLLHYHHVEEDTEGIHSSMPEATDTSALMPPSMASPESMNPPTI
jgi:biopolymer transport protein ExbB